MARSATAARHHAPAPGPNLFEPVHDPARLFAPICRFCGQRCGRIEGEAIWRCDRCDAAQKFDPKTRKATGGYRKSKAQLTRDAAHVSFKRLVIDRIFKSDVPEDVARAAGVAWLCRQLGVTEAAIDFRRMDPKLAARISALCDPLWSANKKKAMPPEASARI